MWRLGNVSTLLTNMFLMPWADLNLCFSWNCGNWAADWHGCPHALSHGFESGPNSFLLPFKKACDDAYVIPGKMGNVVLD